MSKQDFLIILKQNHGSDNPILRKDLSTEQKAYANQLIKDGILVKGTAPIGNSLSKGYIQYYLPQPTWYYS